MKNADVADDCEFVGLYYTKQDENGNPVTEFLVLAGNEIEDTGSLTEEEKEGKWLKSTNTDGDIIYTYYLYGLNSAADLHFVFIKSPTVTYDPNGGKAYVVERQYNKDEAENVYSFKPVTGADEAQAGTNTWFIDPYKSNAAKGQNDAWKFTGWLLTCDKVDGVSSNIQVNADQLGSLILPAEHTVACDFTFDGYNGNSKAQYFKIYDGKVDLPKMINKNPESNEDVGVIWNDDGEEKVYANVHCGLTMVAQWRWRQIFIPQIHIHNTTDDKYEDSEQGGTVEITSVINPQSDENYNGKYDANGGKSYYAKIDEVVTVKATAKTGYTFVGWYNESGNLVSTDTKYSYVETKESIKTFYARFSNSVTQTYTRQVKNGDTWENTTDDKIGTLGRYTYTDVVGKDVSSTAKAGKFYEFIGWYDSDGNRVGSDMLTVDGKTIKYTTTVNAKYYARFSKIRVTQTYIRQIKNGDSWEDITDITDETIGTLSFYGGEDDIDKSVSSTATAGSGYKFVGWYDSEENKVSDDMLTENGTKISYTTTGSATYYARFERAYTLNVSKIDSKSTPENKVPLAGAKFTLYQKDINGDETDETIVYKGESINCTVVESAETALNGDSTEATAVFVDKLSSGVEYYLVEKEAPKGYQLLDSPIKIFINNSGSSVLIYETPKDITENKVNIELTNDLLPIILPTTGTQFTNGWFIVAGILLLATSAIGLFWIKISAFKQK